MFPYFYWNDSKVKVEGETKIVHTVFARDSKGEEYRFYFENQEKAQNFIDALNFSNKISAIID